jgi:hypothetical protein
VAIHPLTRLICPLTVLIFSISSDVAAPDVRVSLNPDLYRRRTTVVLKYGSGVPISIGKSRYGAKPSPGVGRE